MLRPYINFNIIQWTLSGFEQDLPILIQYDNLCLLQIYYLLTGTSSSKSSVFNVNSIFIFTYK
jgi:hypothetical protein